MFLLLSLVVDHLNDLFRFKIFALCPSFCIVFLFFALVIFVCSVL